MRVLFLAMTWDTAGQGAALRAALGRHRPDWVVDQVAARVKRFGWSRQHEYDPVLVSRLWARADIVHLNLSPDAVRQFGRRRGLVVHHHGSEYRHTRAAVDAACRKVGALQVASTLALLGPALWLPGVVDIDALAAIRSGYRAGHLLRVAHSPSLRRLKQTDAVLRSVSGFELELIEGVPWSEAIARKATADVVVDQLILGYGQSAIEAWAMGIPVIAGVSDPVTRAKMLTTFGELPFMDATAQTLPARLEEMRDPVVRAEWGERGRAHVERFHSERAVADRLDTLYRRAA